MRDPVIVGGHTYERGHIEDWFAQCRASGRPCTSPVTREVLANPALEPNRALRDAIGHFRAARRASQPAMQQQLAAERLRLEEDRELLRQCEARVAAEMQRLSEQQFAFAAEMQLLL